MADSDISKHIRCRKNGSKFCGEVLRERRKWTRVCDELRPFVPDSFSRDAVSCIQKNSHKNGKKSKDNCKQLPKGLTSVFNILGMGFYVYPNLPVKYIDNVDFYLQR